MNKNSINKFTRKFGFEIHGTGYIQSIKKSSFKEDSLKFSEIFWIINVRLFLMWVQTGGM